LIALVTGATGFIGSHLVEALLQRGLNVRCLLRKTSDLKWLQGLPVEVVLGDCLDETSLGEAVKGVDQVFHLAAVTKALKEKTYFEINASGTENLIRACIKSNPHIQKFLYLSSQAAAGPCRNGNKKKESDPCDPISPYGQSKRLGEELALTHAQELPLLILRPCAVYGPRERDFFTFFKLISKRIKLYLNGRVQRISLCYVQDVIQAILLAAESQTTSGEIFFLSDGNDYSVKEVLDLIAQTMDIHALRIRVPKRMILGIAFFSEYFSKISQKPSLMNKGKAKEMVQEDWTCDITKVKTILGFQPQFQLSEGIRLTYHWYKNEKWL
jgi:nucleoside-diphosphate-sugar epimerase